ncbi:MAG: NAD(P)-binding protein [Methanoculleus marisnigri]|nr:NAD(P)-binding protein [Methanoculleus marisnigri]
MRAVIVGAGFGGLSVAALLAKGDFDVTVIEKNEQPGGRASVHRDNGFTFDMGPSWYLMPDVYDRFFAEFGKSPTDYFPLARLDPSYRVFFADERVADVSADLGKNYALFESFEPGGAEKLRGYLAEAEETYDITMSDLLYREYRSIFDFFDRRLLAGGRKLNPLENLESFVKKRFASDEARKIVQYSIGFLGGSPRNTPSFYHIMTHIDLNMGVWYPEGACGRWSSPSSRSAGSSGSSTATTNRRPPSTWKGSLPGGSSPRSGRTRPTSSSSTPTTRLRNSPSSPKARGRIPPPTGRRRSLPPPRSSPISASTGWSRNSPTITSSSSPTGRRGSRRSSTPKKPPGRKAPRSTSTSPRGRIRPPPRRAPIRSSFSRHSPPASRIPRNCANGSTTGS